jgi:hypothetical protein
VKLAGDSGKLAAIAGVFVGMASYLSSTAEGRVRSSPVKRRGVALAISGAISLGLTTAGCSSADLASHTTTTAAHRVSTPLTTVATPASETRDADALAALPFPIAYATTFGQNEKLWVGGDGRRPTLVGVASSVSSMAWSTDARDLVATVSSGVSTAVWRYELKTRSLAKWACDACFGAVVVGSTIVEVDESIDVRLGRLLRFPLAGTRSLPAASFSGLPAWTHRILGVGSYAPIIFAGGDKSVIVGWPIMTNGSHANALLAVGLDGRYLRTVVAPPRGPLDLPARPHDVLVAESTGVALGADFEISGCEFGGSIAQLSLTRGRQVIYPDPVVPLNLYPTWLSVALDSSGDIWGAFAPTGWVLSGGGPQCARPVPTLFEWQGRRWARRQTGVLAVAFGPENTELLIRAPRLLGLFSQGGTLTASENGRSVTLAGGAVTVAVPTSYASNT